MKPRKIFIVGSPGSGKTTLAKKLSEDLSIPHFDLDDIRFMPNGAKRPDLEAIPLVESLTQKPAWIIEGVYVGWIKQFTHKADLIIWLDTSPLRAFYRILLRYVKNIAHQNNRYGFTSTLILLKNLILFHLLQDPSSGYITHQQTKNMLSNHQGTIIHIKNNTDLEKLFLNF